MSAHVLSPAAPIPGLLILGYGIGDLIRTYPDEAVPCLDDGMEELTITEEELRALAGADVVYRDAKQAEREAREVKNGARDDARGWLGDVRERARKLALYDAKAAVLQQVLVDASPLAERIREADLPHQVEAMNRLAPRYATLLVRAGVTAATLAKGPGLAAKLRESRLALVEAVAVRRVTSKARARAKEAVVRRLQSLDGRLDNVLPEKGLDKLASYRQSCLPRKGAPGEETAEDPTDDEGEE